MTNKTLFFLTIPVFIGIAILFAFYFFSFSTEEEEEEEEQTYLSFNQVRGMAVNHQALYTLNFNQQNQAIALFNRAIPLEALPSQTQEKADIAEIIVYQFENKPDLLITPLGYQENNLLFSAPQWGGTGFFMDLSEGALKQLLAKTYDVKISSYSKSHSD